MGQAPLFTKGEMMYQSNAVLVLILAAFFAGCADVTTITRNTSGEVVLDSKAKTYVSVPPDGQYAQKIYEGSGRIAAGLVLAEFSTKILHVDFADNMEFFDQARNHARKQGY